MNGLAQVLKSVTDSEQGFGMADEQIAVIGEDVGITIEQYAPGGSIEVDDDITTEQQIEGPAHGPAIHQVQFLKGDKPL